MAEKDAALVKKVLSGDRNAFGDLVEHYAALVHGIVLEKIRRPDEVEDLVQETFSRAYERLPSLNKPSRFGPWVARIASNTAVNWLEHRQAQRRAETTNQMLSLSQSVRRPDQDFEEDEIAAVLWEALDRLPPDYRRIVVLHYLEGCTQKNIARFLDMPLPTVRWRLYRAWDKLRKELGGVLGQEVGYRFRNQRHLREKVMAGLPAMAFFHFSRPEGLWPVWFRRALTFLGLGCDRAWIRS